MPWPFDFITRLDSRLVMAGLDPAIHVFVSEERK